MARLLRRRIRVTDATGTERVVTFIPSWEGRVRRLLRRLRGQ